MRLPLEPQADGSVNVRRFGGMKIERTWFAADKTGFHMLHTLFQTSLQFPQIQCFDEYFYWICWWTRVKLAGWWLST